jgi:hypothetical protein
VTPGATIYVRTASGRVVCGLCHGVDQTHAPDCAAVTIYTQVRELSVQLGLFVATMRETVDALEALLRGDPPEEAGPNGPH